MSPKCTCLSGPCRPAVLIRAARFAAARDRSPLPADGCRARMRLLAEESELEARRRSGDRSWAPRAHVLVLARILRLGASCRAGS